jgi:hypothetical protein
MLPMSGDRAPVGTLVRSIVITIGLSLLLAAPVQASVESERSVLAFVIAWNDGSDCQTLFALRSHAIQLGATPEHDRYMRDKLAAVRCVHPTSKREKPKPAVPRK